MAGSNAHRNVSVDITGDASDLKRAYDDATRSSKKFDDEMDGNSDRTSDRLKRMGSAVAGATGKMGMEFKNLGLRAEAIWAAVLAGVFLLGPASQATAGLMTLAFGGALIGIGVLAAAESGKVRAAFSEMWQDIKSSTADAAIPIEKALAGIPDTWRRVFAMFHPELESAFRELGPVLAQFTEDFSFGFAALIPAIEPLKRGIAELLDALGKDSPELFGHLADAITKFANTTEEHADDFAAILSGLFAIISGLASVIDRLADDWNHFMGSIEEGLAYISNGNWKVDLDNSNTSLQRAIDKASGLVLKLNEIAVSYDNATVSANAFAQELDELNGVHIEADLALLKYRNVLWEVNGLLAGGAKGFDLNTSQGLANKELILKLVKASHDLFNARAAEGAKVRELNGLMETHRHQLYEVIKGLGINEAEAKRLVNRYLQFPKSLNTRITADTGEAQANVDRFITLNSGRQIPIHIINKNSADGGLVNYASGGLIKGPGGSRSDRVPINASRNEYIVNAAATRRHLPMLEAINNGKIPTGAGVGGMTVVYSVNVAVAPTANLSAVGAEVVTAIQAFENRNGTSWRRNN